VIDPSFLLLWFPTGKKKGEKHASVGTFEISAAADAARWRAIVDFGVDR
jgi:hypothetical protein